MYPRKTYNSQSIRDLLRDLKKSDAESMTDFIIKVRILIDYFSSIDDTISDRDKIDFIADELGPDFRPFINFLHPQSIEYGV